MARGIFKVTIVWGPNLHFGVLPFEAALLDLARRAHSGVYTLEPPISDLASQAMNFWESALWVPPFWESAPWATDFGSGEPNIRL